MKDEDNTYEKATIAGPSCDSLDIVKKEMYCPKLDEGDLLIALMLMYGKEASNRKQEIDRQHYTIPNQRPKDKHCGKI